MARRSLPLAQPQISATAESRLYNAIATGDIRAVERGLSEGASPNYFSALSSYNSGSIWTETPLSMAYDRVDDTNGERVLLTLLKAGADPSLPLTMEAPYSLWSEVYIAGLAAQSSTTGLPQIRKVARMLALLAEGRPDQAPSWVMRPLDPDPKHWLADLADHTACMSVPRVPEAVLLGASDYALLNSRTDEIVPHPHFKGFQALWRLYEAQEFGQDKRCQHAANLLALTADRKHPQGFSWILEQCPAALSPVWGLAGLKARKLALLNDWSTPLERWVKGRALRADVRWVASGAVDREKAGVLLNLSCALEERGEAIDMDTLHPLPAFAQAVRGFGRKHFQSDGLADWLAVLKKSGALPEATDSTGNTAFHHLALLAKFRKEERAGLPKPYVHAQAQTLLAIGVPLALCNADGVSGLEALRPYVPIDWFAAQECTMLALAVGTGKALAARPRL